MQGESTATSLRQSEAAPSSSQTAPNLQSESTQSLRQSETPLSSLRGGAADEAIHNPNAKVESSDIAFTDKKGKEHTLTKEVQQLWLDTFNLKSLEQSYMPKLPQDLEKAIGKEIKLTKGSLYKIVEKNREQYIPQIKETLEKPDFALKDSDDMLIIAKEIGDRQYFASVNLETKDYFISISNAPRKENILKNKVKNGAEVAYQSPNAKSIFYTDTLLQEGKSPTNKIDKANHTTKPQTTQDIAFYANPSYIGSGFTGGVIAGIETDDKGNITGFNPQKFAAGFLGGAVGHKAVASML